MISAANRVKIVEKKKGRLYKQGTEDVGCAKYIKIKRVAAERKEWRFASNNS